jgi:hypothetical protein
MNPQHQPETISTASLQTFEDEQHQTVLAGWPMTEREWNDCTNQRSMLEFLRGKGSDRKLRLFAVACCRRIWDLLRDERSRQAVEMTERYLEGLVGEKELQAARDLAWAVIEDRDARYTDPHYAAEAMATTRAGNGPEAAWYSANLTDHKIGVALSDAGNQLFAAPRIAHCDILRDIFGPLPFRPVLLEPSWRTATVVSVAQAAYEERELPSGLLDAGRLAVLADALEDQGCSEAEILNHLRSPGPHVRGCWAVDEVLGSK